MTTSLKTCRECDSLLPLSAFYKHAQMLDGFLNKCKACVKARVVRHRRANVERIREYDRVRSKAPHRKAASGRRCKQSRLDSPEKYRAHSAVNSALRGGKLERPSACEKCGRDGYVLHGHHEDYEKQLDVMWLCPPCHAERHKEINAAYIARLNKDYDRY